MTFSPDSRSIASAGRDGVVRVWDASTGAAISSLASHEDWVTELAFSPDGKRIASLGTGSTLKVREVASGHAVVDVSLRDGTFSAIAFSPDGRRVLVSVQAVGLWLANDPYRELTLRARARFPTHDVRSWNVDTGAEAGGFGGQGGGLRVAQLSRDCRRFAGFCVDGTMRVWDTLTGWNLVTLRPQTMRSTGQTSVIALSDDGKYLASSAATGLEVWTPLLVRMQRPLRDITGRPMTSCSVLTASIWRQPAGTALSGSGMPKAVPRRCRSRATTRSRSALIHAASRRRTTTMVPSASGMPGREHSYSSLRPSTRALRLFRLSVLEPASPSRLNTP